jgi:hypothetical protein
VKDGKLRRILPGAVHMWQAKMGLGCGMEWLREHHMRSESATGRALLYGLWRDETFSVLDEEWAHAALDEVRRWERVTTESEAVALAGEPLLLVSPIGDAEDYEFEVGPDETFDLDECGAVQDGDWPGMPAQWSLRFIPEHWNIGEMVSTTLNGEYLLIEPAAEAHLLELASADGIPMTRDDSLINELARW